MKLTVQERLNVELILPRQGRIIEMKLSKSILDKIDFSADEMSEFQMKDLPGGRVTWDESKALERDFEFTEEQIDVMKNGIKKLDEAGQITIGILPLCEKIYNG